MYINLFANNTLFCRIYAKDKNPYSSMQKPIDDNDNVNE